MSCVKFVKYEIFFVIFISASLMIFSCFYLESCIMYTQGPKNKSFFAHASDANKLVEQSRC